MPSEVAIQLPVVVDDVTLRVPRAGEGARSANVKLVMPSEIGELDDASG
jgi:hypothetical protein